MTLKAKIHRGIIFGGKEDDVSCNQPEPIFLNLISLYLTISFSHEVVQDYCYGDYAWNSLVLMCGP